MRNLAVTKKTLGAISALSVVILLSSATAFAQTAPAHVLGSGGWLNNAPDQKQKNLRYQAFEMGAHMAHTLYFAAITQAEDKKGNVKMNSILYGDSLKARTAALAKAAIAAESINSMLPTGDKLDIYQFSAFAPVDKEGHAYTVAYMIKANLGSKLFHIDKIAQAAFYLGADAGAAEVNAAGGEANRKAVAESLKTLLDTAQRLGIYNAANSTLIDFAKSNVPMSSIHPKVVSLRNWYRTGVMNK